MTKMPRVLCSHCRRNVAALPHGPGQWRASRHDEPDVHRDHRGALVSCSGSLQSVEPAGLIYQLPLPGHAQDEPAVPLF
ncbi:hypothetical protein [Kitasatospora sp. NPDC050543]|uniref:hypothetical protein n=1 Tax=Kitasatospora sp. NPDC050543 TaxID=3364054 RepID=UPI0037BD40E0